MTFPYGHTRSFWGNEIIENGRTHIDPGHSVDYFTGKAIEYIQNQNGRAPFFLFLTYNGPYGHWPAIQGRGVIAIIRYTKIAPCTLSPAKGCPAANVAADGEPD